MFYHVISVRVIEPFKIWVKFADGLEGEADLSDIAGKGVFKRWTDSPAEFFQASVDPECRTVVWPGGLDVAPDGLYQDIADSIDKTLWSSES